MPKIETGTKDKIYYSQCWEDPKVLVQALNISSDDAILSISSGGDNTLALLLQNPQSIIAIDFNKTQNYLLELKIAAIKNLSYQEFINFIGIGEAKDRSKQFYLLVNFISKEASDWWSERLDLIEQGVIHIGKFEKYLKLFHTRILPLMHSKKEINNFLSLQSLEEQKKFYHERWNNVRWRLIFRLFFNKTLLDMLGRQPHSFTYADKKDVGSHYLQRAEHGFTRTPISDNYFLHYMLTGTYGEKLPPYLDRRNFEVLKSNVEKIQIVTSDIKSFLKNSEDSSFNGFNLSDIFEMTTPEQADELFAELARVGRSAGRIAYWSNLVPRQPSGILEAQFDNNEELAGDLFESDRAFVYSSVHILTIKK